MSGIAAVIFKQNHERAQLAFNQIDGMVDSQLIKLTTMAMAQRDDKGKIELSETKTWDPKHSKRKGGFWGLLLGLAFAGPLIGIAAGVGLGALIGRRRGKSKQQKFVVELADNLQAGDSAVFVSFELVDRAAVLAQLGKMGGLVIADELSDEEQQQMEAALEKQEVNVEVAAYKAAAKKELIDKAATDGIQNIQ
jgi:uncharacterized membrane protein